MKTWKFEDLPPAAKDFMTDPEICGQFLNGFCVYVPEVEHGLPL